jgi:hypothetical protein
MAGTEGTRQQHTFQQASGNLLQWITRGWQSSKRRGTSERRREFLQVIVRDVQKPQAWQASGRGDVCEAVVARDNFSERPTCLENGGEAAEAVA